MIKRHKDELEVMKNRLKEIDFYLEKENDYSLFWEQYKLECSFIWR